MAKREITTSSSSQDVRIANEQLAKAQQEYKSLIQSKYGNKSVTLDVLQREGEAIARKYDYVDYGQLPPPAGVNLQPGEIYIGGNGFYVKGIGSDTKTTFSPGSSTTVNRDDAAPVVNNTVTQSAGNANQQTVDQGVTAEKAPVAANQSLQVTPQSQTSGTGTQSTGSQEVQQAGKALENNQTNSGQGQPGVVSNNKNELPVTNNLPGRLSDEYTKESPVSTKGNTDDAATARPMGTAIGGFVDVGSSTDPARPSNNGSVSIGDENGIPVPKASNPGTNNKPGIETRPNLLHEFANWTYNIAWYMLPIETYNTMMRTGNVVDSGTLIAKSGGVGNKLDQAIAGDVYFRNLRFTSVIGNRQEGAATNNFELEMTVVEPYGASLMAQLAAMALNTTGQDAISPAEVPYLLEIDFAGYTDKGDMIPSILTTKSKGKKYIPVRILSIEMKLESAGSVYTITMAPYSYFAQTSRYAGIEFATTLYGNQVVEMLGIQGNGLMAQLNAYEKKKKEQNIITQEDEYVIDFYSFTQNGSRDQAMASSVFAYPKNGGSSTITKTRLAPNEPTIGTYSVGVGSILKDVIKNAILSSQYFNEKVKPNAPNDATLPAELIKVIPVIEILKDKYDPARNEYAKRITFKVFNTLNFGEVFGYVGNAPVSDWGYSKLYNWLFTGKNEDVITIDLSFQYIYYVEMHTNIAGHNTYQLNSPAISTRDIIEKPASNKAYVQKSGATSYTGGNMPERYINATIAAEWFDSKMMSNTGDNVVVNMQIIGDPDWIPQDASLRGGGITILDGLYDKFGSVAIDVAGVYVKLSLRNPNDYNPKTGLMDLRIDNKYIIEGVYQVITVESNLEDGRFTQTLQMVKVPNQEEEKPANSPSRFGRGGSITAN